jgi:hypothetical protein
LFASEIEEANAALMDVIDSAFTGQANDSFNACKYLFVSYKIAEVFPDLVASKVILQYSSPCPRRSYRITSVSVRGAFAAVFVPIFKAVAEMPASLQDEIFKVLMHAIFIIAILLVGMMELLEVVSVVIIVAIVLGVVYVLHLALASLARVHDGPRGERTDVKEADVDTWTVKAIPFSNNASPDYPRDCEGTSDSTSGYVSLDSSSHGGGSSVHGGGSSVHGGPGQAAGSSSSSSSSSDGSSTPSRDDSPGEGDGSESERSDGCDNREGGGGSSGSGATQSDIDYNISSAGSSDMIFSSESEDTISVQYEISDDSTN